MLQKSIFPHKLVIHLILDQAVDRASVEIRELTQRDTELGQTLAASVNQIRQGKRLEQNMYCIFSPKDACSLTGLTGCEFQFLLEVNDVIIIAGLISVSLSHLRDNQTSSPVTPESALHNIGGKVIAKIDDFVPRNIQKFLDTFLNKMCKIAS